MNRRTPYAGAFLPTLTLVLILAVTVSVVAAVGAGSSTSSASSGAGGGSFDPVQDPDEDVTPVEPDDQKDNDKPAGKGWITATLVERTGLRTKPGGEVITRLRMRTEFGSPKVMSVTKLQDDWVQVITSDLKNGRRGWVPRRRVTLARTPWTLKVDLSKRKVRVLKNGTFVRSFHVAVGRPEHPTPEGRFAITDRLLIGDAGSPYGCCALATSAHQPNVPQGWGGGDRIAMHATNHPESIGTAASLGCLRAPTDVMRRLVKSIPLGTPIFIHD